MKDRSDDPSHHEQSLLPRSYISLHVAKEETNIYLISEYYWWSISHMKDETSS